MGDKIQVIGLPVLECNRCGHRWYPRRPERPIRCAKCNSPYWDRQRVRPAPPKVGDAG